MSDELARTVLVVGGGGREHALALRLKVSPSVGRVVVSPGNPGVAASGMENDARSPLTVAAELRPDLVVIGPEVPLCAGLTDELRALGLLVFGPSKQAAQLEGSKVFMKEFAVRHNIRSARHVTVRSLSELDPALLQFSSPPVVKAFGLCAGKGVVVAETVEEARASARAMLTGDSFGDAGRQVLLEERLFGEEVSVHAICDGQTAWVLPPIQDHKRIGEGDLGPNTGGMGTYGPAPALTAELQRQSTEKLIRPIVEGMAKDGMPFVGTLFAGLMITPEKECVLIEINVRFGDPETQVLMNLIDGDFAALLHSAAEGHLDPSHVGIRDAHAMCVVLAAGGYPATPRKGDLIRGIVDAEYNGAVVYHAGTAMQDGEVVTAGGRVLGVTAAGATLQEAATKVYEACNHIHFDGVQMRRDIGHRAL